MQFRWNISPLEIEQMRFETNPTNVTELGQFFAAPSYLLSENTMVQLPANDSTARNLILNEIAPHFKVVKAVWVETEIEEIMMQYLTDSSRKLFQDLMVDGKIPVVADLYRNKNRNLLSSQKPCRTLRKFRVNTDLLEPLKITDTKSIQRFIENAYFSKGERLPLSPTGWKLGDELRHSITLRMFASFVPYIELWVDADDLSVVALDLFPA